jgi:predicted nucleic acid-binding protein
MKLLIDANIVFDVLLKQEPYWADSSAVWKLCETEQMEGYISTLTFANLVYVMRKELEPAQIEDILTRLKLIFRFADFSAADMTKAAEMAWNDFEDAVQSATAERIQADFIITRNVRDFRQSKVVAFTPSELLARI